MSVETSFPGWGAGGHVVLGVFTLLPDFLLMLRCGWKFCASYMGTTIWLVLVHHRLVPIELRARLVGSADRARGRC